MKIGEYIICKNELHHLDNWLKELIKLDVICILDTGSTDGTYERLLELEKTYPNIHVKQQIFSPFYFDDARNAALDFIAPYMKEGDWVLTFDLDEYVSDNFVAILRPQCEKCSKDLNALCIRDSTGCWHWQGHRYSKNCKWFYHIHETILTLDKKELDKNLYVQNAHYFHNQDPSKPRNYRKILNDMVKIEPNCIHYLVNAFEEERYAKDNPEYREWLRHQLVYNVMNNKDDVHYHDYAYLAFAETDAPEVNDELINYFYEAENDIWNGNYTDSRCFHMVFAKLLRMLPQNETVIKKIEAEYLCALGLESDLGWWLETDSTDEKILLELLMWLFYDKKDTIAAEFYAQRLYLLKPTQDNKDNLNACESFSHKYWPVIWTKEKSYTDLIEEIKLLQDAANNHIAVFVQKINVKEIEQLLDMQVHILLQE